LFLLPLTARFSTTCFHFLDLSTTISNCPYLLISTTFLSPIFCLFCYFCCPCLLYCTSLLLPHLSLLPSSGCCWVKAKQEHGDAWDWVSSWNILQIVCASFTNLVKFI
jgi:hypothetical protein